MNKRIVLLSLFLFPAMHGMESSVIPLDILPSIVTRVLWLDQQDSLVAMQKEENASLKPHYHIKAIKDNYALQFVCKDFKRVFWNSFTVEEKDAIIRRHLPNMFRNHEIEFTISLTAIQTVYSSFKIKPEIY